MRARVTAWVLLLAALSPKVSRGEAQRVLVATLDVDKGPGTERCIDEPDLASAVESRLGRRVFDVRTPADLAVRLRLDRPKPGEWRGQLTLLDMSGNELGRREIVTRAKDCSALDASLALVVALLVDAPPNLPPELLAPPASAPPPAAPPPPKQRAPTALVIRRDSFAPREPWRFNVVASAVGLLGVAPRPLLGVSAGLWFEPPRLPEFRVTGEFFPGTPVELDPGRGAELTLVRFGLGICPLQHDAGSARVELCAGQAVGWIDAAGFGFDQNLASTELAYALEAGATGWWAPVRGFGLWLSVGAEVPLVRNAYVSGTGADGLPELYRASPVAGRAQIGAGIEF